MIRVAALALVSMAATLLPPVASIARADDSKPVVLELFTSQGCSSCPPANANLTAVADRPDVLALSFGVTYWDYLGWKDSFAKPQFTARQVDYERGLRHDGPFTPQSVGDGAADTVGDRTSDAERRIGA